MPPKAPLTTIECRSLSHLYDELASVQDALSVTETEETWDSIAHALNRFAALCNGNGNNYPADLVAALRASSRPITSALNSERTRLSGAATDFVTTATTVLGGAFEPLIPHYLPSLLNLCTKANKVFVTRAKAAIAALVEHTQAPMIIHYAAESVKDKSVSLRLASAETLMLCMKSFNPPDLEKEQRAKEIEAAIRSTAVDASADVRKVGRKIFDAYKILLPRRLQSFTDPLTPRTRKYLEIKATTSAPAPRSQPPSRPTSSQSVRSTHSETRSAAAAQPPHPSSSTSTAPQRPPKHLRSLSTSQTTSHAAPPQRPLRAPTPEAPAPVSVFVPVSAHDAAPRRVPRGEQPRRLKVDMPPPDYIPAHSFPQRPMSATELHFPADRPLGSGPQRVIRPDASTAATTTHAARTGPIRPPAPFAIRQTGGGGDDGAGIERRERVIGGARRVLREPEPEPLAVAEDKGKGPVRPRVISTSKSTPAVPLHAVLGSGSAREEVGRVKKLAASAGPGVAAGGAAAAAGAKHGRTAAASAAVATVGAQTASSRARAADREKEKEERRVRERTQEKDERRARERTREKEERRTKEKTQEKEERRIKDKDKALAAKEGREKEKNQPNDEEKVRERVPSKTMVKTSTTVVASTRPAATVTIRDKTNRMHVKSSTGAAKPVAKDAQKVSSRSRSSPDIPEVAENVSPADVPLPETPKVAPVAVQEPSPPALICFDTPKEEQGELIAEFSAEEQKAAEIPLSAPTLTIIPSPADVPLPSSKPGSSGSLTPPQDLAVPPTIDVWESHTPAAEHRPARRAEVEQTPISALVASIQRRFLSMHKGSPLPPMIEEEESMLVLDEPEGDGRVFDVVEGFQPVKVEPLFSRPTLHAQ